MFSCRHLDLVRIPGPPALDQDELLVIGLRTDRLLTHSHRLRPTPLIISPITSEKLSFAPDVRQSSNPDQVSNDYIDHISLFFKIQGRPSFGKDLYFTLD